MGRNGVIVLAQEQIEIDGLKFLGPFHSIAHFLEAPDKWCNKPYFGFKKNSKYFWHREGNATLINMAIVKACGVTFHPEEWNNILRTLVWYHMESQWAGLPKPEDYAKFEPIINEKMAFWSKERILREWRRKNTLIRRMPKEPYIKMRYGMYGAVAA